MQDYHRGCNADITETTDHESEDALPTWWTNKLAVASNSMNKMRLSLVPSVLSSW